MTNWVKQTELDGELRTVHFESAQFSGNLTENKYSNCGSSIANAPVLKLDL